MKFYRDDFITALGPSGSDPITPGQAADRANKLLSEHIASLPVVNCYQRLDDLWIAEEKDTPMKTHTARLWGIEEIKPKECEHEPQSWVQQSYEDEPDISKCKKCGIKLRARWEEVKE